jgi:predicted small integral membrane protein
MKRGLKNVLRISKVLLLLTTAIYFSVVVFGNVTDYNSNFQFVNHVLSMDTTFEGNSLMWRAITNPVIHHIFYWVIILWELAAAVLCWVGAINGFRFRKSEKFKSGLKFGVIGLVVGLLLWYFAFMTVGGEWFAMWQSSVWNGQQAAFRMFAIQGISLLFLFVREE